MVTPNGRGEVLSPAIPAVIVASVERSTAVPNELMPWMRTFPPSVPPQPLGSNKVLIWVLAT